MTEWPGRWIGGASLQARRRGGRGVTNDHGIRWFVDDVASGEWIRMSGDVPVNHC